MQRTKHSKPSEAKTMTYIGSSMNPILRSGDRLEVVPYGKQKIRRGDVIVFVTPGGGSRIIHRVVAVDSHGIRTRGDNSKYIDSWVLRPSEILGRVFFAQRGSRRLRVFGGPLGHLFAVTVRAIKIIDSSLSSLLRPLYQRLARAGIFGRWLPACMKTKAISLSHPAGTELQLLMGKRVIGRWLPGMRRWHIRRPFRLFVDEATLPENKAEVSGVRFQVSVDNKDI